jgi:2-iminobutanoate/2-iminopropanoate deaminase
VTGAVSTIPASESYVASLGGQHRWSDAVIYGDLVFTAPQVGWDDETGSLVAGFEDQARRLFDNLKSLLEQAGSSLADVVVTRIYLTSEEYYQTLDKIYHEYLPVEPPARPDVVVEPHLGGALVSLEVVAIRRS